MTENEPSGIALGRRQLSARLRRAQFRSGQRDCVELAQAMNDEPDFFHVGVGGAERLLKVVLAAFEPSIFRSFVSGKVGVVLSVYAKHGRQGVAGEISPSLPVRLPL